MKRTLEIKGEPEKVIQVLTTLKKDSFFSKTYEGTAKNGSIEGFYTVLGLFRGYVVGLVKINGKYNLTKGDLILYGSPSNVYWFSIVFILIVIGINTYIGFNIEHKAFIGSFLFLFLGGFLSLMFLLERQSFLKRLKRIIKVRKVIFLIPFLLNCGNPRIEKDLKLSENKSCSLIFSNSTTFEIINLQDTVEFYLERDQINHSEYIYKMYTLQTNKPCGRLVHSEDFEEGKEVNLFLECKKLKGKNIPCDVWLHFVKDSLSNTFITK